MCKFCDVQAGDCELIACEYVDVRVGNRKLEDQMLTLFSDKREIDDRHFLLMTYDMDSYEAVAKLEVEINYCPFCGKDLRVNKSERRYPWGEL